MTMKPTKGDSVVRSDEREFLVGEKAVGGDNGMVGALDSLKSAALASAPYGWHVRAHG